MFPNTPTYIRPRQRIIPALAVLHPKGEAQSLGQTGPSDAIIPGQQPYLQLRPIPTSLMYEELGPVTSRLSHLGRQTDGGVGNRRGDGIAIGRPRKSVGRSVNVDSAQHAQPIVVDG